jgi:hypothetical protein
MEAIQVFSDSRELGVAAEDSGLTDLVQRVGVEVGVLVRAEAVEQGYKDSVEGVADLRILRGAEVEVWVLLVALLMVEMVLSIL